MTKTILITGATAGIGKATAWKFAEGGYRMIITGRRKERLLELAEQMNAHFGTEVLPLAFDLRVRAEVQEAVAGLPDAWKGIDILVNNAGLALGLDPIHQAGLDDWDTMIDTNIKGLLYMTHSVVPLMIARGHGHIFNVGSIAGKEVYPKGSVYCATKHAVDALTKGMRIELMSTGIKVTQVAPGAAETEFSLVRFKGDAERAAKVYQGYEALKGEDIAEVIYFIANLPDRVNINDILIMPKAQANATVFNKL